MNFQSIETAPRDGSEILLFSEKYVAFAVAKWTDGTFCVSDGEGSVCFHEYGPYTVDCASHWAPLERPI